MGVGGNDDAGTDAKPNSRAPGSFAKSVKGDLVAVGEEQPLFTARERDRP